jgi:hypothetical protein
LSPLAQLAENGVTGYTVGVARLPTHATADTLLASLRRLTAQTCKLGWISSGDDCAKLRDALRHAGDAWAAGDTVGAKSPIGRFMLAARSTARAAAADGSDSAVARVPAYQVLWPNADRLYQLLCRTGGGAGAAAPLSCTGRVTFPAS